MSTKKFKFGIAAGGNVKGGKNNTRTVLNAAGIAAIGAASAGAGYYAGVANARPLSEGEETLGMGQDENSDQAIQNQENQQFNQSEEPQQTNLHPQNDDGITEPQPIDHAGAGDYNMGDYSVQNSDGGESVVSNPEEVDANLIAQQIVEEQNIDPYDIDCPTIISVDELASLYRADGSEMLVAAIHTPDGEQFLLADIDGDGYFTDVFDMDGNYVGEAEGNLMASDLETMMDDTGGYLAQNIDEPMGDDPTVDIVPTSEIVDGSVSAGEDVSDEDLLAQLLEEGGDEEGLIEDDWDEGDTDEVDYNVDDSDMIQG